MFYIFTYSSPSQEWHWHDRTTPFGYRDVWAQVVQAQDLINGFERLLCRFFVWLNQCLHTNDDDYARDNFVYQAVPILIHLGPGIAVSGSTGIPENIFYYFYLTGCWVNWVDCSTLKIVDMSPTLIFPQKTQLEIAAVFFRGEFV